MLWIIQFLSFSALDAESEHLVQEALERLTKGRTVITIAHRLSTIKNADNIVLLSDRQISEAGSYAHLMGEPNGLFRKLVEKQTIGLHYLPKKLVRSCANILYKLAMEKVLEY